MTVAVFALLVACGRSDVTTNADGITRTRRGDTIVVRMSGDGVWGPAQDAIEVFRLTESSKETTLGQVMALRATPDGGVILYDAKALDGPVIRQFDPEGRFVRNVGRAGSGPGEYNAFLPAITVRRDGTLFVRQSRRGVSWFSADGRLLGDISQSSSFSDFVAATDGTMFMRGESTPRRLGLQTGNDVPMVRYDTSGNVIDSIDVPAVAPEISVNIARNTRWLVPSLFWFPVPDGRVLVARSDRLGFQIVDPLGGVSPLEVERAVEPVIYTREERRELQAWQNWDERSGGLVEGTTRFPGNKAVVVPKAKMPIRYIELDIDERVWIERTTPSAKTGPGKAGSSGGGSYRLTYAEQERLFAVFQLDGTFIGDVRFPRRVYYLTFVGDFAWGMLRGDDGTPVLIKYRLH